MCIRDRITVDNVTNGVIFDGFADIGTSDTAAGEGFSIGGTSYIRDTDTNGDTDPRNGVVFTGGTAAGPTLTVTSIGTSALRGVALQFSASSGGVLLGDVNEDETVDFLDISPFISVLSGGTFQAEADCDENGVVDFLDISPFITILAGGGS